MSESADPFERLLHKIDPHSALLRAWPLHGGVSAQVTALDLRRPDGRVETLVVRRHGAADLARNPRIAADEFALLQRLRVAGMPVPAPRHLEPAGAIFPDPALVVEYVAGAPPAALGAEQIDELAQTLARIHALDWAGMDLAFLPGITERYGRMLKPPPQQGASDEERRIRRALDTIWPLTRRNPPALLHGDYWPGNTLWRDERLVAVIDWEDAAIGDPLADLANSRIELIWAGGVAAMEAFTRRYRSLASVDLAELPAWDLCAVLRPARNMAEWGLEAHVERRMREDLRGFVDRAVAALP